MQLSEGSEEREEDECEGKCDDDVTMMKNT